MWPMMPFAYGPNVPAPSQPKESRRGRRRRSSSSSDEPRRHRSRRRRGRRDHDRGSPSQASSSVAQGMIQVDVNHYTALVTQAAQAQAAPRTPRRHCQRPTVLRVRASGRTRIRGNLTSGKANPGSRVTGSRRTGGHRRKGAETERNGQRAGTNGSVMRKPQEKVRR